MFQPNETKSCHASFHIRFNKLFSLYCACNSTSSYTHACACMCACSRSVIQIDHYAFIGIIVASLFEEQSRSNSYSFSVSFEYSTEYSALILKTNFLPQQNRQTWAPRDFSTIHICWWVFCSFEIHGTEYTSAEINLHFVGDEIFPLPLGDNVALHFIEQLWWRWSILCYF